MINDPLVQAVVRLFAIFVGLCVVGAVVAYIVLSGIFTSASARATEMDEGFLDDRRRMTRAATTVSRHERKLRNMDAEAFARHLDKNPRDPLAVEMVCERLEQEGRWAEFSSQMQYLLTLKHRLTREEVCNRYNRLADLYLDRLNRPERAREMLQTIVAQFPRHYQATLARRRLEALAGNAPDRRAL